MKSQALVCALLAACFSLLNPAPLVAGEGFDVSYVWSANLSAVQDYRTRVMRVLGRSFEKNLVVVSQDNLYGLIYRRNGDSASTARVVKSHSALLKKKGLDAVSAVQARNWTAVPASSRPEKIVTRSQPEQIVTRSSPDKPITPSSKVNALEQAVEAYIDELRRTGKLASDERTGWSVYDFTTGQKLVTINEDVQFQAASLVKPFIAAAFFEQVKEGKLVYGPKSRRHMQRMIQHSNNASTNWVNRQVGGPQTVEKLLKTHYPEIFQDTLLVEYIPANGKTYRNRASVHDYSRFLYALWNQEIAGADEIKRLMALPGSDRLYTGVPEVPKDTKVYNKTGSTARLCGDMGILSVKGSDGKRYPYILIGVIEKQNSAKNYTTWIRSRSKVIRDVSAIVYKGVIAHHNDS
ncbi:MAG: serine hydrolase [Candidatus Thiodiazotropha sp.]